MRSGRRSARRGEAERSSRRAGALAGIALLGCLAASPAFAQQGDRPNRRVGFSVERSREVANDRVLATSLGYYVTPLVNVGLGVAFLGERLSGSQVAALALAAAGVVILAVGLGEPPWIALALAGSFGVYGLVRKRAPVGPVAGFGVEMGLLAPCAAVYLLALAVDGGAAFSGSKGSVQALVAGSGAVTAAPLLCFNSAARRLRLATLGFFQYLAPSVTFLLAVFAFGEPFTRTHALAFGCVWLALAVYSRGAFRAPGARPAGATR